MIQFCEFFSSGIKAVEIFVRLLTLASDRKKSFDYNKFAHWLFSISTPLEFEAKDFETAVATMFERLSSSKLLQMLDGNYSMPLVILKQEGVGTDYYFYNLYCYLDSEGCFINLQWPNEAPKYIKHFFDLKLKEFTV